MQTGSELRSEFRSALEAVTPPAPWLAHDVKKGLGTRLPSRRNDRAPLRLRLGLNVVALVVLIGLAVAAIGVYLTIYQAVVPANSPSGPLTFPSKMFTPSTGWAWVDPSNPSDPAASTGRTLLRTTDGGTRWTNVTPPSLPDRLTMFNEARYLLDATHAWLAESGAAGDSGPYVTTFRTTDGGQNWQRGASVAILDPSSSRAAAALLFPQLFFLDQDHGWLLLSIQTSPPTVAMPILYSTDDGGAHWKLTPSDRWSAQLKSIQPGTMVFSSLTTGWLQGIDSSLLVTRDGGVTWHVQPLPVTASAGSGLGVLRFSDPQHGLMLSWSFPTAPAVLLATSDGGSTWVVRSLPGEVPFFTDFADANHGWAIGVPAADFKGIPPVPAIPLPLYKTDDGGVTWVPVPTDILWGGPEGPIDVLDFVDQNTGFAIRDRYMANGISQLLKTTDGGRTWTIVEAPPKPSATAAS